MQVHRSQSTYEDEVDELAGLFVVGVVAVVVEPELDVVVVPAVVEAAGAPVPVAVEFKQLVLPGDNEIASMI